MDIERTDDAEGTGHVHAAYINDLKELRREYGCTPERLGKRNSLHAALSSRLLHEKRQPTLASCVSELKNIIEGLGDSEKRGALLAALGLDERHKGRILNDRRESYLATLNANQRRDIRTLQRWEDKAIEVVARILTEEPLAINQEYFGSRLQSDPLISEPLNLLLTTHVTNTCYYSERGIFQRCEITRWVEAPASDIEPLIVTENAYLTENWKGRLATEPVFGCAIDNQYETAAGLVSIFKLHKRLDPSDGEYAFGYRRVLNGGTKTTDPITWWTPERFTGRYELRVIFHKDMVPLRAWWFITGSIAVGQFEPSVDEGRHLELLDNGRYVFKVFEDLHPYHPHGIAWIWS